jgi:hypothetical protein
MREVCDRPVTTACRHRHLILDHLVVDFSDAAESSWLCCWLVEDCCRKSRRP